MEENVMERDGERKALAGSLILHLILFLIAAACGLFSVAEPSGKRAPIDVVLYDAGGDAGSAAGDAAPAATPVVTMDDIVVQDKNIVQQEEQKPQTKPQQNTPRTVQNSVHAVQTGSAGESSSSGSGTETSSAGTSSGSGTGSGTEGGDGSGDGSPGISSVAAPPKERVEASLRSEAVPEYPQELIDDDVEGVVTIKILVAADGSVESVSVESSSGYRAMDRAAVAAGWRFRFNPGDNGRRGVWTKTFRFQLN